MSDTNKLPSCVEEKQSEPEVLLPEKPVKPLESECCGTGCTPCVFDIYNQALLKWEKGCRDIINGAKSTSAAENDDSSKSSSIYLSPTKYEEFKIISIIPDPGSSSKVLRINCSPESCATSRNYAGTPIPVAIGQHVVLMIDNNDKKIARKYTVLRVENEFSSSTSSENHFDILIRVYPHGLMTSLLDKLVEGDNISIRGPFNNPFAYTPNERKLIVMLAAGTGIAPMYRIIETVLQNEEDETRVRLFYANRTVSSIMLMGELKEWSSYWNFQVNHYISAEPGPEEFRTVTANAIPYGMKVHFQKITQDVIRDNFAACDSESNTLFLICGTNSFEKDMINYLQKIGVNNKCMHVF